MADLFDRLKSNPDEEDPPLAHLLAASIVTYHNNFATVTQIKNFLNADVGAAVDFDALIAHFDTLTQNQKLEFMWKLEAANVMVQEGVITTKAEYATFLGI